jgi:hypothetical protein
MRLGGALLSTWAFTAKSGCATAWPNWESTQTGLAVPLQSKIKDLHSQEWLCHATLPIGTAATRLAS